jgi:hemolysin activation/secretion protein
MPPLGLRVRRTLFACAVAALHAAAAAADGAWSFENSEKLYPRAKLRPEDVPVPHVEVEQGPPPPASGDGLEVTVQSFEVVGATLIAPSEVKDVLRPFLGEKRTQRDLDAAKEALQRAYEERGFALVTVLLPQQPLLDGRVRLEVIEARLGRVTIENPGVDWYSDGGVRRATPHLVPGAVLRTKDQEEDLIEANRPRDRRVTPVQKAGAAPGTVDLELKVDDRIPLHGYVEWNNYRSPGSPRQRAIVRLGYENLWQREHAAGLTYTFAPYTGDRFEDVQIFLLDYSMPMPWSRRQTLFAYANWSDSTTLVPGSITSVGKGFTSGLRFNLGLPLAGFMPEIGYDHSLVFGVDYKSIENSQFAGADSIVTPIRYLPWTVGYEGTLARPHSVTTVKAATVFHFAGTIDSGGSEEDFQANVGGVRDDTTVDGTWAVYNVDASTTLRLPALLTTLAQGRFVELEDPWLALDDDWSLAMRAGGQFAEEPLVSSEQFPLGGRTSVRPYLEGELFGDHGYYLQVELRSRALERFLGGFLGERLQLLAFYDRGEYFQRSIFQADGIDEQGELQAVGLGVRASLLETEYGSLRGEAYVGLPTVETFDTKRTPRLLFQVRADF